MNIDPKSIDNAIGVLDQTIYTPVFFQKLASAGISPSSQEEALEILQLGAALRDRVNAQQSKQASSRVEQLRQMRESLSGQPAQRQAASLDFGKQAAANPQIADAILHILANQNQAA